MMSAEPGKWWGLLRASRSTWFLGWAQVVKLVKGGDRERQRRKGSETGRRRDTDREQWVGRDEVARSGGPAWVVWVLPGSPAGDPRPGWACKQLRGLH